MGTPGPDLLNFAYHGIARRARTINFVWLRVESILDWRIICCRAGYGIHPVVSSRRRRDAGRLARSAAVGAWPVRRRPDRVRCNLPASCDRYAEAVVLRNR